MDSLLKRLKNTYLARCKYWGACNYKDCFHFEPHHTDRSCKFDNPVKYCGMAKGFVCCVPMDEIDLDFECDPNVAYRAKLDAEKRDEGREETYTEKYIQRNTERHHGEWMETSGHRSSDHDQFKARTQSYREDDHEV